MKTEKCSVDFASIRTKAYYDYEMNLNSYHFSNIVIVHY